MLRLFNMVTFLGSGDKESLLLTFASKLLFILIPTELENDLLGIP